MKTIRDVLNKHCDPPSDWHDDEDNLCCHECGNNPAKALKEIETIIKASKPEKPGSGGFDREQYLRHSGYISGINDYEANLLKVLGGNL